MTRRLVWVLVTLAALPLLGLGAVYGGSELRLRAYDQPPAFQVTIPSDSASLERGRHLTRTRGCFGCHGQALEGQVFEDEWPWVKRAVAPNLAAHARAHDAQVLANAIRAGVGHDGRALWSMPSYNVAHLPDRDLAAIIGYLRSAEIVEQPLPEPALGRQTRWWIATGDEDHMAGWAAGVPPLILGPDDDAALVRGERLAMTTCNECHGLDLRGSWREMDISPPDLAIVAGYSREAFETLMRTGVPIGGRDLGLMAVVARDRFAYFAALEVDDLYAYLTTLAARPVPRASSGAPSDRWRRGLRCDDVRHGAVTPRNELAGALRRHRGTARSARRGGGHAWKRCWPAHAPARRVPPGPRSAAAKR